MARKTTFAAFAAAILLSGCSGSVKYDPSRTVAGPIDLDYAFAKGASYFPREATSIGSITLDQIPEEYRPLFEALASIPGAIEAYIRRMAPSEGYREAADPVVSVFQDKYWLFPSKSQGYWCSDDMISWTRVNSSVLPLDLYAPTTMVMDGYLYWMTSDINELYRTKTPSDGESWELVTDHLTPYPDDPERTGHDPDLLLDDDGRVYLYWGCSNVDDIMGIELDPAGNFKAIGQPVTLVRHMEKEYGWERPGNDNEQQAPGYNEGASLIKRNGKYFLQYASPGTQYDPYGDGLYVADSPLGPYTHMEYSPMSVRPGGWMTGAGHGDTFQDKWGNYWHVATTVISQRHNFERRIAFFPVIFTKKGHMYALTEFADYPFEIPSGKTDFLKNPVHRSWVDLSIGKKAEVSSEIEEHPSDAVADRTIKTWWSAQTGNKGEYMCMDLGKVYKVGAVQANFADEGFPLDYGDLPDTRYSYTVEVSTDGDQWTVMDRKDGISNPHTLSVLSSPIDARYVKVTNQGELPGNFSSFGLRVFGPPQGEKPDQVSGFEILGRTDEGRRISFRWNPSKNATGYLLRWGTEPDELYSSCEVFASTKELGLFSAGQKYYFRIDAFGEGGVTQGKEVLVSE